MVVTIEHSGFRRTLRLRGRNLRKINSGKDSFTFRATVNRIGDIPLVTTIGDDPRAKRIMEIERQGAPKIYAQDSFLDIESNDKFKTVRQLFDCPEYALRFEVVQVTEKDQ